MSLVDDEVRKAIFGGLWALLATFGVVVLCSCDDAENSSVKSTVPTVNFGRVEVLTSRLPETSKTSAGDAVGSGVNGKLLAADEALRSAVRGKSLLLESDVRAPFISESFFCDGKWEGLSQGVGEQLGYPGRYEVRAGAICITSEFYPTTCRRVRVARGGRVELGVLDEKQTNPVWRQYSVRALPPPNQQGCAQATEPKK